MYREKFPDRGKEEQGQILLWQKNVVTLTNSQEASVTTVEMVRWV
jgi:hypothetical protein